MEAIRAASCGGLFPLGRCLGEMICLARDPDWSVAQIFNLPYRRIVFGRASDRSYVAHS